MPGNAGQLQSHGPGSKSRAGERVQELLFQAGGAREIHEEEQECSSHRPGLGTHQINRKLQLRDGVWACGGGRCSSCAEVNAGCQGSAGVLPFIRGLLRATRGFSSARV